MIDKNAPEIVKVDGQPSSQTIEPCSSGASQDGRDDQAHLSDPVGCANLNKSLKSEHLNDAHPSSCDTSVLHTNPSTYGLTDCPHEDFSDSGCRTTVIRFLKSSYERNWGNLS